MINKKEVDHIADLAHLKINEDEKELFTNQLDDILNYVDKLNELDTEGIKPTAYTVPMKNVYREDKVKSSITQKKALANAPKQEDGQFKVSKIISD